jgi:nucleotide-binding universal stress UspA family protein
MKHILFPTDFSACANNALEHACMIAKHFNAAITVLHVYPIPIAASDVPTELIIASQFKEDAEKNMAALKANLQISYPSLAIQTVASAGDAASEINYYLKENPCDIIIMGTTGAGGLKRLAVGSTAASVLNHARVPLLIIPADKPYREIKHIVVSSSLDVKEIKHIKHIYEWYKEFNCKLSLLRVDDVTTYQDDLNSIEIDAFINKLKQEMHGVEPSLAIIKGVDVSNAITEYVKHAEVDLLVTVHQHRGFFAQLVFPSITKDIVFHPPVPMLIFNRYD